LDEVVGLIIKETKKRHQDWPEEEIASASKKIALAAIKFYMLRVGNNSVITFDLEEAKSYDGFTGPYLQYTVSRINSILNKPEAKLSKAPDLSQLNEAIESELLVKLAEFPEAIAEASKEFEPSRLAKYLFDLARLFSSYYQSVAILTADTKTKEARLALIKSVRQTLVNGLGLLGIETLERM
jgi:arginyl-tRNA synthetase